MIRSMSSISPDILLQQLQWRYATKQFDPAREIPSETWSSIEDSLALTPSSFGLQPWHFIVIKDQATKEALLPHSWNQVQVTECSHFVVLAAKTEMNDSEIDRFLARTVELRGGDIADLAGYRDMMSGFVNQMDEAARLQWAKLQTYIALGQLMTSAATLGIDACPMEGIVPGKYDDILKLSEKGLTTSVACALGYRSSDDKYASLAKVRFEKADLITTI